MTTDTFVIGASDPLSPIAVVVVPENVVLTDAHRVGFGPLGLVAYVPVLDGGQTNFIALYNYRTFTWKPPKDSAPITFDRVQFEAWLRIPGNSEYE